MIRGRWLWCLLGRRSVLELLCRLRRLRWLHRLGCRERNLRYRRCRHLLCRLRHRCVLELLCRLGRALRNGVPAAPDAGNGAVPVEVCGVLDGSCGTAESTVPSSGCWLCDADAFDWGSGEPHEAQNFAPAMVGLPHCGHVMGVAFLLLEMHYAFHLKGLAPVGRFAAGCIPRFVADRGIKCITKRVSVAGYGRGFHAMRALWFRID